MKVAVLGASGGVGRKIVERAVAKGHIVTAQTRDATKLSGIADRVRVTAFDPLNEAKIGEFARGQDAIIFALGIDRLGATTLFSDVTARLLAAMKREGVRRLIAITGVGAGDTRGHGGLFYDWIIFPLITRGRYADKDRQEALIENSDRDWIIVRPAPFANESGDTALEVHTHIRPDTILRRITRDEVADFVVDQLTSDVYLRQKPFIGHS